MLKPGDTRLSPATIEERGWYHDLPDRHTQREQVLRELAAWSASDEIPESIRRMERQIESARLAPTAAAERTYLERLRGRSMELRRAVARLASGDNRGAALALRDARDEDTLASRARTHVKSWYARPDEQAKERNLSMADAFERLERELDEAERRLRALA